MAEPGTAGAGGDTSALGETAGLEGRHAAALVKCAANRKLSAADRRRLSEELAPAYLRYRSRLARASRSAKSRRVAAMVRVWSDYRRTLELFVYDSDHDTLPRGRGQLRLDSTCIEEFMSELLDACVDLPPGTLVGSQRCLTKVAFDVHGTLRPSFKDVDVAAWRLVDFCAGGAEVRQAPLAVMSVETKVNLDKTMFTEIGNTASSLRAVCPAAAIVAVCEWLDMTPRDLQDEDVDGVYVLRGSRPPANERYTSRPAAARVEARSDYVSFLEAHPPRADVFLRIVAEVNARLAAELPTREQVVDRGYF